jgi:hypothetical protein
MPSYWGDKLKYYSVEFMYKTYKTANCGIREGGVKLLSNEIWKNLSILSLSNTLVNQAKIKLEIRDVSG